MDCLLTSVQSVLTAEFIDGMKCTDRERLALHNIDRKVCRW